MNVKTVEPNDRDVVVDIHHDPDGTVPHPNEIRGPVMTISKNFTFDQRDFDDIDLQSSTFVISNVNLSTYNRLERKLWWKSKTVWISITVIMAIFVIITVVIASI